MTRIREHLRKGVALALLALALQLAAFGHVHHASGADGIAAAPPIQFQPAPDPHDGQSGDHDDRGCALCAVLSLAASSIPPDAPQIELPHGAGAGLFGGVCVSPCEAPPAFFRARAPPRA